MEEECIARLGLDGHHPIAPPGLEHLVTEEQWGEYWTWLHWYSSWQMWYMKKGKKPIRKSDKDKRSDRRRADAYESPDDEEYHEKRANANWRLDVGWRLQQFVMLVLVVNIAVMASETLESPRFSGSDPAFAYVLSQNTCNCIEAFFTILYVVEFVAQ
uniref:Ion transport domain-containing protein n=1 Tax=Phytophthora ramorum TaxID=164328 RepID=H3HD87_PHYRM